MFPASSPRSRRFTIWFLRAIAFAVLILAVANLGALWSTLRRGYNDYVSADLKDIKYVSSPLHINEVFPRPKPKDRFTWNYKTMLDLQTCVALKNCGPNQQKVAILAAHWFEEAYFLGFRGGEGIWALSMIVVRNNPKDCYTSNSCIKSQQNPRGIPAWKIFDFDYFPNIFGKNPNEFLDARWILSALPNTVNPGSDHYIGFSQETTCTQYPVIPLSERANTIWLFMKQLTYIYVPSFAWSVADFHNLIRDLSMSITGGWAIEEGYMRYRTSLGPDDKLEDIADPVNGIFNLGVLDQPGFLDNLRKARVMLAIGDPRWSPSPFEALCLGVPVVHPYWKHEDGAIEYQNGFLAQYGPPYVYHVEAHNYQQLHDAIKVASETPINRFIPKIMTEAALRDRLVNLMETNWRSEANILLQNRVNLTDVYKFEL
ncbi:hypothetical protein BDQ17DRAFT_1328891 [Cyathus striatus]|nr:hypothetical protein BDQ17DRAFT_1328891 [Cyathus striatus]